MCYGPAHLLLVSESLELVDCYLRWQMEFCDGDVKVWDGRTILDYSGRPIVIIRVHIREEEEESQRRR